MEFLAYNIIMINETNNNETATNTKNNGGNKMRKYQIMDCEGNTYGYDFTYAEAEARMAELLKDDPNNNTGYGINRQ